MTTSRTRCSASITTPCLYVIIPPTLTPPTADHLRGILPLQDAYHEIVNEESPHPENLAEKVASFITEEDALHAEPARTVAVAAVVEEPVAQAETEGEVQAKL